MKAILVWTGNCVCLNCRIMLIIFLLREKLYVRSDHIRKDRLELLIWKVWLTRGNRGIPALTNWQVKKQLLLLFRLDRVKVAGYQPRKVKALNIF